MNKPKFELGETVKLIVEKTGIIIAYDEINKIYLIKFDGEEVGVKVREENLIKV